MLSEIAASCYIKREKEQEEQMEAQTGEQMETRKKEQMQARKVAGNLIAIGISDEHEYIGLGAIYDFEVGSPIV